MTFLGRIMFSRKGLEIGPKKTGAFKSWPRPITHLDIQSFLGLTSYYRILLSGFL